MMYLLGTYIVDSCWSCKQIGWKSWSFMKVCSFRGSWPILQTCYHR